MELADASAVAVEAKGCGDGNNMAIWDRPAWAEEFVIWSLCPESLQHHPGHGVWSGISTRLAPKIIAEKQLVDAFVLYDPRCGSALRPCPKPYGVYGLRSHATEVVGQDEVGGVGGKDWMPPPSIYLFPRTIPQAPTNPKPAAHTPASCKFASALLAGFGVPSEAMPLMVSTVDIEVELRGDGTYRRVLLRHGQNDIATDSGWLRVRRDM